MNKHGITLIEFIVSLALVSVVMIFLFNLLIDIQYNSQNNTFASENQLNRASIVKTIMSDFSNLGLTGITDSSSNDYLMLNFHFKDGSSKNLKVEERSVVYGDERWSMKAKNNRTTYQTNCAKYSFVNATCCIDGACDINSCSDYFYVHIRIPVIVGSTSANTIDDLELFYVGESKDVIAASFPEKSYLGYDSNTCSN